MLGREADEERVTRGGQDQLDVDTAAARRPGDSTASNGIVVRRSQACS
jgi:hypothetical protein